MKKNNSWVIALVCLITGLTIFSCQKDNLSRAGNLFLSSEQDTIRFDTVFSTMKQITQKTKLFNRNSATIQLSDISLAGGPSSPFKININGQAGSNFSNLIIEGGDSLYIFITVDLPQGKQSTPLFYQDSIVYQYKGQAGKILLYAYGQDAYFLSTTTLNKDTTWNNELPIILNGNVTVAEHATLRIAKGTRIYAKAGTSVIINGTLKANGGYSSDDLIIMTNNRMDPPYDQLPGGWGGIRFGPNSHDNQLNYLRIKNAIIGITDTNRLTETSINSSTPTLQMEACQISNSSKNAVQFRNAKVQMTNCLLFNAAQLIYLNGGSYNFRYCTFAAYTNDYVQHSEPILSIQNTGNLNLVATNSIIYGDNETMDELDLEQLESGAAKLAFNHCLIKNAQIPAIGNYDRCIWAEDPGFAVIDNRQLTYDFQILNGSPAIYAAKALADVSFDMIHQNRSETKPTIGCLEFMN